MFPALFFWRSGFRKFEVPVSLQIEKSGQVGMVELECHFLAKQRLAMKGHAKTRRLKHRHVVGTIADAGRFRPADPEFRAVTVKKLQF